MDCDPTYSRTLAGLMGFIIIVDSSTGERLTESLRSIMFLDRHVPEVGDIMVVKNTVFLSSNSLKYSVNDLDGVYIGLTSLARAAFRFKKVTHQLVVQADDCSVLFRFIRVLHAVLREKGLYDNLDKHFDPIFQQYLSAPSVDRYDLNVYNLNKLILENVDLSDARVNINQMPVSYLSLSGSTLGDNRQQDDFWDWLMTFADDTLTYLKMNSMGLKEIPYEIMYMKNLHTLSLAMNKLTYIPHFIGELNKLECLYINGNMLEYLPGCLQEKTFKYLNITDNNFKQMCNFPTKFSNQRHNINLNIQKEEKQVCLKLSNLSFHSLINNRVKVSRRDIPQALRHYYDTLCRCKLCSKFIPLDYAIETYNSNWAKTSNIITNFNISWQFYECPYECSHILDYFDTLHLTSTSASRVRF